MLPPSSIVDTTDSSEDFAWLRSLATPRPFAWLPLVQRRRMFYIALALLLTVVLEGWPEHQTLSNMGNGVSLSQIHLQQVPLYLGMLVVVAFVGTCYALYKQFDDSKWLARHGQIAEANLLSVLHGNRQVLVSYRFFDFSGREIEREAVITAEGRESLPRLVAGDVVPVLYDRKQPARRNLLWPEIARYVALKAPASRPGPQAIS